MVTVYYMTDEAPKELYFLLEEERLAGLNKNPRSDKDSIAGAGLLLAYAAAIRGIKSPLKIIRNQSPAAKPRLKNNAFEFSLSHTLGLSLCAVSDKPVGADAELIRPVQPELCKHFNIPCKTDEAGIAGWTALESVYKLFGGKYKMTEITLKESAGGFIGNEGCAVSVVRIDSHILAVAGAEPVNFIKISAQGLKGMFDRNP